MSDNNLGILINLKSKMAKDSLHDLSDSFVRLGKDGKRANDSITGLGNSLSFLKRVVGTGVIMRLGKAFTSAAQSAMDIRESVHLFKVAMGDSAVEVGGLIEKLSELSGMDKIGLLDTVGEYNLLARSMGVTSDNAAVLSENVARLSLDLSSLTNRSVIKVQEDLRSGLIGQSKTMYKYGIDVTEAALKQEALNQGITKSVRHMSQAEKMQLRYIVMLKQSALSHGDFAETLDAPANQMRIFSSRMTTVARSLGTIFIPALTMVLPYLNAFAQVLDKVFRSIARLVGYEPKLHETITNTGDTFGNAAGELEDGFDGAADSANNTGKEANKLKRKLQQLAGFDELNILGKRETESEKKTNKDESLTPIDFDLTGFDSNIDSIKQKSDEIFEKIMAGFDKLHTAMLPTVDAFKILWDDGLAKIGEFSWNTLKDFYNLFLKPVGVWTLSNAGLPRLFTVLNDLVNRVNFGALNGAFGNLFKALVPFATTIGTGLIDFLEYAYGPFVVWTFNTALPTLLNALADALDRVDWGNISDKFRDFSKSLGDLLIASANMSLTFWTDFLVPIGEWTIGTGLPDLLDILTRGMESIKWDVINNSFSTLLGHLSNFGIKIGEGLLWFLDNVLIPISSWTISEILPRFLDGISNVLRILNAVIEDGKPIWGFLWDYLLSPLAEFVIAPIITTTLGIISGILGSIAWVLEKYPIVTKGLVAFLTALTTMTILSNVGNILKFAGSITGITGAAKGLVGGVKGVVGIFQGAWSLVFSPTGLIILGIVAVIAIIVALIENWDKVVEVAKKVADKVSEYFEIMSEAVGDAISWIGDKFSDFKDWILDIPKKVSKFADDVVGFFSGMGEDAKKKVDDMTTKVTGHFSNLSKDGKEKVEDLKDKAVTWFSDINKEGNKKIGDAKDKIVKSFKDMNKDSKEKISDLKERAITWLGNIKTDGTTSIDTLKTNVVEKLGKMDKDSGGKLSGLYTTFDSKFGDIKDGVGTLAGDMLTSITDLPSKMAKGITKGASALKTSFVDMWDGVVKAIKKPVNAILGGANWILEKFGAPKLTLWDAPGYAKGTDGHSGGPAIVNDQRGSTYREAVQFPNGETIIPKGRNVLIPNMPIGTKVLPAKQTKNLQMYSKGIGNWASNIWDAGKAKVKSGYERLKTLKDDIWDFVKNPSKLVSNVLTKSVDYEGIGGIAKSMGKGVVSNSTGAMVDWVKDLFKRNESNNPNNMLENGGVGFPNPPFRKTSSFGYRIHPISGQRKLHTGVDLAAPYGTPINAQKSGRVTSASYHKSYGNMVRIAQGNTEQLYAHMSKILTKAGMTVGAGNRIGLVGSTGNSTGNHLHYEERRGGSAINPGDILGLKANNSNSSLGSNVTRWTGTVKKALDMNGLPTNETYTNAWLRQIKTESGGNPRAVQGNIGDINNRTGDLAKGLVQVIGATFKRYKFPGHENRFNGLDSLLAGMNYAKHRYGKEGMLRAIGRGRGYARGGFITGMTSFNVAGESGNEGIVPLEGRHMMPFADAIASRLTEQIQKMNSNNKNNQGGIVVNVGGRTIVDMTIDEMNRRSRINGKLVIEG